MRVAVGQVEPVFGDVAANITMTEAVVREAAAQGADLVVLPELVSSGYMMSSREEAFALAEPAGAGPATSAWKNLAAELGVFVVAGFPENDRGRLFNASILCLPDGTHAVYRKVHLWDEEALYFEPGDLGFAVVDTRFGRLGMMICYDGWFPESYRSLALQGVDVVCVPTNWVPIPGQAEGQPGMATILTMGAAHSNGVIVAAADRVGVERGQEFIGQSLIVSHTGWPLAGPAAATGAALLVADVDVAAARRSRAWGAFNHPVRDRRPDAYRLHPAP
ncbi:nitrilase family protein [Microbacterium trichothecenolyticum]|uniref:N-carbamoylputrescine amidase n=1 Tax=Microbacterium trichothecenolyticum TaxID=69370 RepID=A0ABU0TWL8_MICTR|nr:nitrilase family protein [Microbacterium trichothecenolyticum]MDQ1124058.1 N-carbamoylputrescine amidase [Microbacterium trichothecenolyticum]